MDAYERNTMVHMMVRQKQTSLISPVSSWQSGRSVLASLACVARSKTSVLRRENGRSNHRGAGVDHHRHVHHRKGEGQMSGWELYLLIVSIIIIIGCASEGK